MNEQHSSATVPVGAGGGLGATGESGPNAAQLAPRAADCGGSDARLAASNEELLEASQRGFAQLMQHVCRLYTCGDSSSVSGAEASQLASSVLYVLGSGQAGGDKALLRALAREDVVELWTQRRQELSARMEHTMELWQTALTSMPPLNNIALRDTLASIGQLPSVYDTFFAAHEVPASIDYPLAVPVSEELQGLDYLDAWLQQLIDEARFL
ncbi:MAG: DUF6179 domain-containing protein, partial [Coriobacteriales bacterium]